VINGRLKILNPNNFIIPFNNVVKYQNNKRYYYTKKYSIVSTFTSSSSFRVLNLILPTSIAKEGNAAMRKYT